MGPQLYRCGNLSCDFSQPCIAWLQWGRNFIVAEMVGADGTAIDLTGLQWGRNFIVAEIGGAIDEPLQCSELQWGRNFIVAEIR